MYLSEDPKADVELMKKHTKVFHRIDLSEIHDCPKCHDKIVSVSIDSMGNEYCGYCNERVDYSGFFKRKIKEMEDNELRTGQRMEENRDKDKQSQ